MLSDFAQIHSAYPAVIVKPTTINELKRALRQYSTLPITIAGSQCSQGGQTLLDGSLHIDLKNFNRILHLDINTQLITVQSGATWHQIFKEIDQYNLSVSEMQSYSNFTVGGSVSVNCHGRGFIYGTVADSVTHLKLMTALGHIIEANREHNYDLFRAVVGGYGGVALILEVTLRLTLNCRIRRQIEVISPESLDLYYRQIVQRPDLVFYNANIYPTRTDRVVNICWVTTDQALTVTSRLQPQKRVYPYELIGEQLLRLSDTSKKIRSLLEPKLLSQPQVVWKNYEMTYDTQSLQPLTKILTTTILQEYFVPLPDVVVFLQDMWRVLKLYHVNVINVSLRYVKKTSVPILNYAPEDRIAVVLYINIVKMASSLRWSEKWTHILTQLALNCQGSFYLPYLLLATPQQFQQAYPQFRDYLHVKAQYDPQGRLTNHLIRKYLSSV